MTLLVVLLVILLSMVDSSTKLWRASENRVDSFREARAAINIIAADLSSILPNTNPAFFKWNSLTNLAAPIQLPADGVDHLFFLSAQTSDAQDSNLGHSDLCVIGYFLSFEKTSTNSPSSLNLYRYFRNSDDTFKDSIKTGDLVPTAPSAALPAGEELLARNVTAFHVAAFTAQPDGKLEKFKQSKTSPVPNVIEVQLTVINNEAAQRLTSLGDWRDTTTPDRKKNARTFTTRVRIFTDSVIAGISVLPSPTPKPAEK